MAVKELWANLLAHDLIRMVMAQSALLADCLPRELSFKHSLQLCLAMCQYGADPQGDGARDLLKLIARKRVGNLPGRIEARAIKRRPKPYPMLMQKRSAAGPRSGKMDTRRRLSKCHSGLSPIVYQGQFPIVLSVL